MPILNKQGRVFTKSPHHMPVGDRFERFVDRSDSNTCWEWQGCRNSEGYGQFRLGGRMVKAHRVALMLVGRPPADGMEVLHSCDNPACVNPSHLSEGTVAQNQKEAWARGKKERVHKLSPTDVMLIRASTLKQKTLSGIFGVCQAQISRIRSGARGRGIMYAVEG